MTLANFIMTIINAINTKRDRKLKYQSKKRNNTLKAIHVYRKTVNYYKLQLKNANNSNAIHLKARLTTTLGIWSEEYLLSKHSHIDYDLLKNCIGDDVKYKTYKALNALYPSKEDAPYNYSKSMIKLKKGLHKSDIL